MKNRVGWIAAFLTPRDGKVEKAGMSARHRLSHRLPGAFRLPLASSERLILPFFHNPGRKTAAHFRWNCPGSIVANALFLAIAVTVVGSVRGARAENAPPTFEQIQRMPQTYQKRRTIRRSPPARAEKPQPRRAETPPPPPEPVEVEKLPDARTVMVVGDFLASELAAGLTDAYAKAPGVKVVDKTNGSSGFVRNDFYDWDTSIGPLLDAVKPAVVVMMIGSNDRQPITVDGKSEPVRSDGWVKEYTRRVTAFAKIIADRHIPLVWVGVPAFRSASMTSDMLAFNDIYQNIVGEEKGTFVDIWDGFVDNNGAFTLTGPDVNGQPTRLRLDDGVNFSRAGKAKIAFYAEKDLNHLLGDAVLPGIEGPPSNGPGSVTAPAGEGSPQRTAPISLRDQGMDDGKTLAGATVTPVPGNETAMEKLTIEGIASTPPIGRADNFGDSPVNPPAKQFLPPPSDDDAITRIIQQSQP